MTDLDVSTAVLAKLYKSLKKDKETFNELWLSVELGDPSLVKIQSNYLYCDELLKRIETLLKKFSSDDHLEDSSEDNEVDFLDLLESST